MTEQWRMMIEPLIAISTAHLTEETVNSFSDLQSASYPNEYGAFVYVGQGGDYPEDLKRVLDYCRERGIVWVKFDRDAGELADLPTYEWR